MSSDKTKNYTADAMSFYYNLFHPNCQILNLDEVTRYIFKYCRQWMTDQERKATQYLAFIFSANSSTNQKSRRLWLNQAKKILDKQTEELLKNGEEAFLYSVRDRLLSAYGNSILNVCPRCGALARTAQAKQCSKCFYQWHDISS